jgi:hypothetical protein
LVSRTLSYHLAAELRSTFQVVRFDEKDLYNLAEARLRDLLAAAARSPF